MIKSLVCCGACAGACAVCVGVYCLTLVFS